MFALAGLAVLEFYYRKGDWNALGTAVLPWAYLATGIQLALYFSSVIVSVRACTEYDSAFARIDKFLMFGATVIGISRNALSFYGTAEFLYYSIGGVMGAAILFLCLSGEWAAAFQMCGAILTAYYISLVLFFLLPAPRLPFTSRSLALPPQIATDIRASVTSLARIRDWLHHSIGMDHAWEGVSILCRFSIELAVAHRQSSYVNSPDGPEFHSSAYRVLLVLGNPHSPPTLPD